MADSSDMRIVVFIGCDIMGWLLPVTLDYHFASVLTARLLHGS